MTHAEGTPGRAAEGTPAAAHRSMTMSIAIERQRRAFSLTHEPVCVRCGHGESLHPQRDLACLVCDQRASVGLLSHFCTGFLSDRAPAGVH
jgi:hypothetical protein